MSRARLSRRLAGICVALIAPLLLLLALPGDAMRAAADEAPVDPGSFVEGNFNTEEVALRDITDQAASSLTPVFRRQRWLTFPHDNAWHSETLVENGARVRKGDVLMRFRRDNDESQARRLDYAIDDLEAAWRTQRADYAQRLEALAEAEGEESPAWRLLDIERSRALANYEGQRQRLGREREALRAEQEATELVAPFDGVIVNLNRLHPDTLVQPWEGLLELRDDAHMLWRFEDSRRQFRYGQRVTVRYGPARDQREVEGEVVSTAALLERTEGSSEVIVRLLDVPPEEEIRITNARVEGRSTELLGVLTVSRRAVYSQSGRSYVYLLEDGIMKKRYFVGGAENVDYVQVVNGLQAGDIVVVR